MRGPSMVSGEHREVADVLALQNIKSYARRK
jgi:hypothetical protein